MILKTEHHNKLIFQLPTDHFDVVHAALEDYNTVATNEKEAHCECFGIRNGSVNELHIYCDGRGEIFGGTIGKLYLFGHAALAYYGPSCIEGTIEELHVYRRARLSTDMKTLQHLIDTGCKMWFEVGAVVNIDDRYYRVRLEQTSETFLSNIKTVEKVTEMMDEKIKERADAPKINVDVKSKDQRIVADITIENPIKWWNDPVKNVQINPNIHPDPKIKNGPYTVCQLIEALARCQNQDAPVFAYLERLGARLDIMFVDDSFENHRKVDLNINDDYLFDNEKGDDRCEDRQ